MTGIEFYITPAGEIMIQEEGEAVRALCQGDQFINSLLEAVQEFYPKAFESLAESYKSSSGNKPYYRF
jgi:hypothetical protein